MANNKKISQLNSLPVAASGDLLAIVDISAFETKKITAAELMTSSLPADFSSLTLGSDTVTGISTDGTLSGDSDTAVPTEKAVKTYVDEAVGNAVKLNVVHTGSDSTAVVGDVYIIDTTGNDVDIVMLAEGKEGKIIIIKNSGPDTVNIIPGGGASLDGSTSQVELNFAPSSFEYICDGINFYTI